MAGLRGFGFEQLNVALPTSTAKSTSESDLPLLATTSRLRLTSCSLIGQVAKSNPRRLRIPDGGWQGRIRGVG